LLVAGAAAQKVLLKWDPPARAAWQMAWPDVRVVKAISGFQSRESYRQPPPLMKTSRKSAGRKVTLASASGPQHPRRAVAPLGGVFYLTLAAAKRGGRHDRRAISEEPQSSEEPW